MTDAQSKALYISEQCRMAGMTMAGAAGVIANVEAESAFKSTNLQDSYEKSLGYNDESYTAAVDNGTYRNFSGDDAGYGLAQWTAGDRKAKMLAYFQQHKKSIGDFQTQVAFLIYEMSGYRRAWLTCTTSNDPYQCGYDVCKYYEIPANTETQSQYRGSQAKKWYDWLAANTGTGSTIPEEPKKPEETTSQEKPTKPAQPSAGNQSGPETTTAPDAGGKTGRIRLRMIDQGIQGWPEVWLLQAALKTRGYNVLIDGIFGASLTAKTEQFQAAAGLDADGVVGPLTWAALLDFQ